MKLIDLLKGIDYKVIKGSTNISIRNISYDSRTVKKSDAFVCLVGIDTDGHKYINDVINKGCKCIITCKKVNVKEDVTIIEVQDTRLELPYLSANLFKHPGDNLIKIAITGTKGKTSTSYMIKSILENMGKKVGVIGTLGTYIDGNLYKHKNTTPESYLIQKYMREMVDNGVEYLVMETSSQALKVGRIKNINFEYGIFTNLSLDHIGPREHETYEDYRDSKARLFKQCKIGILNSDDKEYKNMIKDATCKIYTYGCKNSDVKIKKISSIHNKDFLGMEFNLEGLINGTFRVSVPGDFSVYNATSAIFLANLIGAKLDDYKALESFKVRGRSEIINVFGKKVIIDFAHNQISMESIIKTMKKFKHNHIITVFGCGGGRGSDRRYDLGFVSGKYADFSIITMDNPRNDDIEDINKDIIRGINANKGKYEVINDRKEAIEYALQNSQENDIILLLGKGHEDYQEIKNVRYKFSELDIINDYIKRHQNE